MKLDSASRLAQITIGVSQVTQSFTLAAAIADLASNSKRLLDTLNGAPCLAQSSVCTAQVAQVRHFSCAIIELTRRRQRGFKPSDGLARVLAQGEQVHSGNRVAT